MDRYIGFYSSRPFWAKDTPIFTGSNPEEFFNIMSEEVFIHENDNYKLKICRDGLFLFQIKEMAEEVAKLLNTGSFGANLNTLWSTYLDHLNCIYILFESSVLQQMNLAYFEIAEITNRDAFAIWFEGGRLGGHSVPTLSVASKFQSARYISTYRIYSELGFDQSIEMDERVAGRIIVTREVFDRLVQDFDKVFSNFNEVKILSNLIKSLSEYKIANYDTSLILSWFIIESYLSRKWRDLLNTLNKDLAEGSKRINSDRMKYFSGRDYPINIVINMLELFSAVSFEKYKTIDRLRTKRNDIVHTNSASKCNPLDCIEAFKIISSFIEEDIALKLEFNVCYSLGGL